MILLMWNEGNEVFPLVSCINGTDRETLRDRSSHPVIPLGHAGGAPRSNSRDHRVRIYKRDDNVRSSQPVP